MKRNTNYKKKNKEGKTYVNYVASSARQKIFLFVVLTVD